MSRTLAATPGVSAAAGPRARYDRATGHLDPPLAVVDLDAFDENAADLARRAGGHPIRVASKSLRCRYLIERVLARPGYRGVMCYSLAEALWLHTAGTSEDLLVAYPVTGRKALRALAGDEAARRHIAITIDSPDHLDLIDRVLGDGHPELRVCLELDVSWRPLAHRPVLHIGTWRSPLHTPEQAAEFAEAIVRRPGFRLAGLMGYEGQIAGLGDAPPGQPVRARLLRLIQDRSARELRRRRAEAVRRIRALTGLDFVNGGGTGSLESTAADESVTELAAGSGLAGPTLFDAYRRFRPRPALLYALPVARRPRRNVATLFTGGYVASGTGTPDRLPAPFLPAGLRLTGTEGAGEVQTPVRGAAADGLRPGDRVWLRHAKAGELAERFTEYHLVRGDELVLSVPTYRGEGQCFG
ncbi:MAG: amino acid deaminase/aldolase [Streptosporangiaceae bacterium]|nr:amino acid deaminase/aldolase [Streptosporangiaceae bacterium]MBV9856349.1 amino acid deaminase/aldolase [Streptosporangiaceae bacterium]